MEYGYKVYYSSFIVTNSKVCMELIQHFINVVYYADIRCKVL